MILSVNSNAMLFRCKVCNGAAVFGVLMWREKYALHHCSYDGIPFLLHDTTFRRTTNIQDVFPKWTDAEACWLNMSQIKQLDAGSWFIKVCIQYLVLSAFHPTFYPSDLTVLRLTFSPSGLSIFLSPYLTSFHQTFSSLILQYILIFKYTDGNPD